MRCLEEHDSSSPKRQKVGSNFFPLGPPLRVGRVCSRSAELLDFGSNFFPEPPLLAGGQVCSRRALLAGGANCSRRATLSGFGLNFLSDPILLNTIS